MMPKFWIINGLLFQAAWWSCALLTDLALGVLCGLIILHFVLSTSPKNDLKMISLSVIGWVTDTLLLHFNVLQTTEQLFPFWLMLLWVMFILCLNHSLAWLKHRPVYWSVILGAIAGPLSYLAAIEFGALTSELQPARLAVLFACIWAVLLPILTKAGAILTAQPTAEVVYE